MAITLWAGSRRSTGNLDEIHSFSNEDAHSLTLKDENTQQVIEL